MDKNQKELHVMLAAMLEEIRNTRAFLKTIFYEQLDVCRFSERGAAHWSERDLIYFRCA